MSITPDEILRDRLVFGMCNDKVREHLLHELRLTLTKTDEICRAAESLNMGNCVTSVINPAKCNSIVVCKMIDDNGEDVFPTQIAAVGLDDSQFVMLKAKIREFYVFRLIRGHNAMLYHWHFTIRQLMAIN